MYRNNDREEHIVHEETFTWYQQRCLGQDLVQNLVSRQQGVYRRPVDHFITQLLITSHVGLNATFL